MDEASGRRFRTLRKRTRELLEGGEQSSVEFKREVPRSIALQAAAGANFVALNPSIDVHTILLGVTEETLPNGASRGRVIGCLDSSGGAEDLDQLRLRVEQQIRDAVDPPPHVTIIEEQVASSTPILVVEIRPTAPPHRVGDRYPIRGAAGVQPLTQHDALQLFRNQRTQAWIDELEDSNPLLAVLQTLQQNYEDLAYRVSDAAMAHDDVDLDQVEHLVKEVDRSLDGLHETVNTIESRVDDIDDSVSRIEGHTDFLSEASQSSPVQMWRDVRNRREMKWLKVNHHVALGRYTHDDTALIETMVREHFGDEPQPADFVQNLAELQGYNIGHPIDDDEGDQRDHLEVVIELVSAAIARSQGVPLPFSADWIAEGIASRKDYAQLLERATKRSRPPAQPKAREVGILELSAVGAQALADHRRATTSASSSAIIWRADQGVISCARVPHGQTIPVMYRPTWGMDTRRGKPRTGSLEREFKQIVDDYGGGLLRIEGPGVMLTADLVRTAL